MHLACKELDVIYAKLCAVLAPVDNLGELLRRESTTFIMPTSLTMNLFV